jgi:hypothetical protein
VRKRRWWLALALLLALAAALYWGLERYRYRFVHSDADLLHLLPASDASLFYADVNALRRGGYLNLLAGSKQTQDPEYARFVHDTGFDYTRDLSTLAGSVHGEQILLILHGHFDWGKIKRYAAGHSDPRAGRSVRLREIQPDVLAFAISPDPLALEQIRPAANNASLPSSAPVWLQPSAVALLNPSSLPLPIRIFAISLQSAQSVVLSLDPPDTASSAFVIALSATFRNDSETATAFEQLQRSTSLIKGELAREHQQPNPRDLTGLLLSGSFYHAGPKLTASWPVRRELLDSLR